MNIRRQQYLELASIIVKEDLEKKLLKISIKQALNLILKEAAKEFDKFAKGILMGQDEDPEDFNPYSKDYLNLKWQYQFARGKEYLLSGVAKGLKDYMAKDVVEQLKSLKNKSR